MLYAPSLSDVTTWLICVTEITYTLSVELLALRSCIQWTLWILSSLSTAVGSEKLHSMDSVDSSLPLYNCWL